MTEPTWERDGMRLYHGDALDVLKALSAGTVHCVVTSPPYYGLRDYGVPGQFGLETDPAQYIERLVAVFGEVRRVLRDDGVCWIVVGDSYGHGTDSDRQLGGPKEQTNVGAHMARHGGEGGQLMLIPSRLMLALQADGWIVRQDLVWAKVAPMPESVDGWRWERHRIKIRPGRPPGEADHIPEEGKRPGGNRGNGWGDVQHQPNAEWQDCPGCPKCSPNGGYVLRRGSWRHTRAHETVIMATKQMGYWADAQAVKEANAGLLPYGDKHNFKWNHDGAQGRHGNNSMFAGGSREEYIEKYYTHGRNPRSVLTPKPQSFNGQHFAVYPPDLIRPFILSTCPERCCSVCGAGWAPVVEHTIGVSKECPKTQAAHEARGGTGIPIGTLGKSGSGRIDGHTTVLAYRPTCACNAPAVPGTCLDPFVGSGTTLAVAAQLGRRGIGIDLSEAYLRDLAIPRIEAAMMQMRLPLELEAQR